MTDESTIKALEEALLKEWDRQADTVYFWDPADRDLIREGEPAFTEFGDGAMRADSFDKRALIDALLSVIIAPRS